MKPRFTTVLLFVAMALLLAAGCAKKKTAAQPQAVVIEDSAAPAQPEPYSPPAVDEDQLRLEQALGELSKAIHFDFDKSDIRAGEDRERLQNKAVILQEFSSISVTIEGHCDERGTNEYNMALGSRRANSAKEYLKVLGVDPSRIDTVSYGEERPVDPGHTESAWAKNRRDEFMVRR